jgi:RNA recognition motif-containing protein
LKVLFLAGGVIRVAKRIYVSNLTWRTSWQDLKDHFRQVGNGEGLSSPLACV